MTTNYHSAIASNGQPANASTFNTPFAALDEAISNQGGGANATAAVLKAWAEAGAFEPTSITWDTDGVVSSATVKWPDGSAGTFTRTTKNAIFLTIDAYTVTHSDSGQTVTQTAVTRDSNGNVTTKPALTVA